jgi:hypothetical protein
MAATKYGTTVGERMPALMAATFIVAGLAI